MLPSVDPFPASVSEADPGRNRGRTAGYRGGIYAYLADGHICLFSRLPGGRPAATSGANHARQRWFSPVEAELRRTLQAEGRRRVLGATPLQTLARVQHEWLGVLLKVGLVEALVLVDDFADRAVGLDAVDTERIAVEVIVAAKPDDVEVACRRAIACDHAAGTRDGCRA